MCGTLGITRSVGVDMHDAPLSISQSGSIYTIRKSRHLIYGFLRETQLFLVTMLSASLTSALFQPVRGKFHNSTDVRVILRTGS
jgi:hypothetical protein